MRPALLLLLLLCACRVDLQVGRVEATADASDRADAGRRPDAGPENDAREDAGVTVDAGLPADAGDLADAGSPVEPRRFILQLTPMVTCADALGGQEAAFSGIGWQDVGLEEGVLDYEATPEHVRLTGAFLGGAFGTSQLELSLDVVPDQPPGTYLAVRPIAGAAGPLDTEVTIAAIYVDTLLEPPRGEAAFQYETDGADGACFVSFPFSLVEP